LLFLSGSKPASLLRQTNISTFFVSNNFDIIFHRCTKIKLNITEKNIQTQDCKQAKKEKKRNKEINIQTSKQITDSLVAENQCVI